MSYHYIHDLSPFIWEFAPGMGLRWYGTAYVLGFFAGYGLFTRWQKEGWLGMPADLVSDFLASAIAGILAGGRLGYCLFYDFGRTVADPLSVLRVWEGGMASHGGILGLIVGAWWFARRHGLDFWRLSDALSLAATPGIFLGRVANFINGELWGRPSEVPWAVIFPAAPPPPVPRHPSQIYEALLEGLLMGVLLLAAKKRWRWPGSVFGAMLVIYPALRIFGEFFREPDREIGYLWMGLSQGQWLSVAMLGPGLAVFWWRARAGAGGGQGEVTR